MRLKQPAYEKYIVACFLLLLCSSSFAQKKAVTEEGKQVILYADNTWKYVNDEHDEEAAKIILAERTKPKDASFVIKGGKVKYGIWYNPKKWNVKKDEGSDKEYLFQLKGEDAFAMLIPERVEIPMDNLKEIALNNARKAAPDVQLIKDEIRQVNNLTVHFLQFEGTIQGVKLAYLAYYYSYSGGSVQFVAFTGQSLLKKYQSDIESLLDGFTIAE